MRYRLCLVTLTTFELTKADTFSFQITFLCAALLQGSETLAAKDLVFNPEYSPSLRLYFVSSSIPAPMSEDRYGFRQYGLHKSYRLLKLYLTKKIH